MISSSLIREMDSTELQFPQHNPRKDASEVCWENWLSAVAGKPLDNATKNLLQGCTGTVMPPKVSLHEVIERSNSFPLEFPIDSMRFSEVQKTIPEATLEVCQQIFRFTMEKVLWNPCFTLVNHLDRQSHANSVYPLIREDMLPLIADWMEQKKKHGTPVEKTLYENVGLIDLVQRLLERRAGCFVGQVDLYKILEAPRGFGGWEQIGTEDEKPPLVLKNYMSFDEIKLSAMLTMSSQTASSLTTDRGETRESRLPIPKQLSREELS